MAGERLWGRFLHSRSAWIPALAAALHLSLTLYTHFATLQDFPNSGDEYAYLVSAEIFSRGQLSVPSPPARRFFDVTHVINDGRFYGKYSPGWPALLAVGFFFGVPWLVNPLLGVAVLLVLYGLARRHFSVEAANITALLLAGSPFLVFNAASFFSHTACLLAVSLFMDLALRCAADPAGKASFVALGLCAGAAFSMRSYTAVALLAPPTAYLLWQLRRPEQRRALATGLAAALLPFLLCTAALLAYNKALTGDALLNPFQLYGPGDLPGLRGLDNPAAWMERARTHVLQRSGELGRWLTLSPLLFVLAACSARTRRDPKLRVLMAASLALMVAYFFHWALGGFRYGPRYLFEAAGALTIVSAVWIAGLSRGGPLLVALLLGLSAVQFAAATGHVAREIAGKKEVYREIDEAGLSGAIVLLKNCSGMAPIGDCPRNGIDFDGPVLLARDLGPANRELLAAYPERKLYVYRINRATGRGELKPYVP